MRFGLSFFEYEKNRVATKAGAVYPRALVNHSRVAPFIATSTTASVKNCGRGSCRAQPLEMGFGTEAPLFVCVLGSGRFGFVERTGGHKFSEYCWVE